MEDANYYVPYRHFDMLDKDKNHIPIRICEILDDEMKVKEWAIVTQFQDKKHDVSFPVGGLVLDFFNETYNYAINIKPKNHSELYDKISELEYISKFQIAIKKGDTIKAKKVIAELIENDDSLQEIEKEFYPNCKVEVLMQGNPFGKYKNIGMGYDVYGDFMFSFTWIDAYNFLKNNNAEINICTNCRNTYIKTSKNQKYCPCCSKNQQQLRLSNNEQLKLRNKIKDRLNRRDFSFDYGYGIYDSNSFSDVAIDYKKEHTDGEYFEWLKEIEKLTDKKQNPKIQR